MAARDRQRERLQTARRENLFECADDDAADSRWREPSPDAERLLERAMQQQGLTARAHDRTLKVAPSPDLEGVENLSVAHLAEAIQYRTLDRSHWA